MDEQDRMISKAQKVYEAGIINPSPRDFLKKLGAVRPMAPAGVDVLVLGKFNKGHYPIRWTKAPYQRYQDEWLVFGVEAKEPLTEEDCKRILSTVGG